MPDEKRLFEILPKIVPVGCESVISIRPLEADRRWRDGVVYAVTVIPAEGYAGQTSWVDAPRREVRTVNGTLQFSQSFDGEQEYVVLLESVVAGETTSVAEFRLYALEIDLFLRHPYKGDIHMHSRYSDGKDSPAHVAAACRRIGLDFMAVTDHRQYAPSLEAIRAFQDAEVDLRIYPGEEVHPPENPVHIINFGGRFSVNDLFETYDYRREVKALEQCLADLPAEVNRYTYASCGWCFEKIREAGGLGVFCHPYWFAGHRYDVPTALTDLLFEEQPYDALEVIGGYHEYEVESNTLQVARYQEERATGRQIPIVGVSDAHGCETGELFGWYYTIVFAHSADLADLIGNTKDLQSVAVEALPGQPVRAYGPFRLVKFAQYLFREIFPAHDELCLEEGRLMLEYLAGDEGAADLLSGYKGRVSALYDRLWGVECASDP